MLTIGNREQRQLAGARTPLRDPDFDLQKYRILYYLSQYKHTAYACNTEQRLRGSVQKQSAKHNGHINTPTHKAWECLKITTSGEHSGGGRCPKSSTIVLSFLGVLCRSMPVFWCRVRARSRSPYSGKALIDFSRSLLE